MDRLIGQSGFLECIPSLSDRRSMLVRLMCDGRKIVFNKQDWEQLRELLRQMLRTIKRD